MEGDSTRLEESLLLGLILVVSSGPVVAALAFGGGSPVEVGLGSVLSFGVLVALYRVFRPSPNLADRDDDGAPPE